MTDYVPGPWYSSKTSVVCFYGTRRIQVATTRQPLFTPEAQAANARLIAAAPELLAALQDLAEEAARSVYPQPDKPDSAWAKLVRARAAIAKATGK